MRITALVVVGVGVFASKDLLSVFEPKRVPKLPKVRKIALSEYDTWMTFEHGPENPLTRFAKFQVTSTSPSLLLMTSYVLPGASFSYKLDSLPLQNTTMPRAKGRATTVYDPQQAYDEGEFSRATLVLDIGPHYLNVSVGKSPFANGLIAMKLVHLQIDPKYHEDYFLVETPVPVELANRTCQAFSSHLVHLPSHKELGQIVKLFTGKNSIIYIGGYKGRLYDGSPLVLVANKNERVKISKDIWNYNHAMVLCYRRYPPQQKPFLQ